MEQLEFKEFQANLENVFKQVTQTHQSISVTYHNDQTVVILDAKEYNSLMETLFLSQPSINDQRLRQGIEQHRQGQVKEIDVAAYLD